MFLAAYDGEVRARPPGAAHAHACRVGPPRGDVGRPPAGDQHARDRLRGLRLIQVRPAAGERRDTAFRTLAARSGRRLGASAGLRWLCDSLSRMTDPVDPPDRGRPPDPGRSWARQVPLAVLAFVATLALLFGLASLVARSAPSSDPPSASIPGAIPTRPGASRSAVASLVPSPTVTREFPAGLSVTVDAIVFAVGRRLTAARCTFPVAGTRHVAAPTRSSSVPATSPTADSTGDTATANLVGEDPGTVFTAGDNAYPDGSRSEFKDCYGPTWGRFLERHQAGPGEPRPRDARPRGLPRLFRCRGRSTTASPGTHTTLARGTSSFSTRTAASSGGCGRDSAQGRWLASDLAASAATCTMAIWHHPRWSSGGHGSDADVGPFWDAALRGRRRRHRQRPRPRLRAFRASGPGRPQGRDERHPRIRRRDGRRVADEFRPFFLTAAEQRAPAVGARRHPVHAPRRHRTTGSSSATTARFRRAAARPATERRQSPHPDATLRLVGGEVIGARRRMADHARAVIIGGGVGGTSIAYHLARPWLDRHHPRRARRADVRVDLPLGGSRRPASKLRDADEDDDVRHRPVPRAGRRDRHRPGVARGRVASAGVDTRTLRRAPPPGRLGQDVRPPARADLRDRGAAPSSR